MGTSRINWTPDKAIAIAKQYSTRIEFSRNDFAAYQAARRLGVLEQACSHMQPSDNKRGPSRPKRVNK